MPRARPGAMYLNVAGQDGAIPSTLTRFRSAGSAPCGHHGRRGAPGRHSERFCGAPGLIQRLPLHTRPRADPTRCLKCSLCSICAVDHLHASTAERPGRLSARTVKVGASVESRADTAREAVPLVVEHGPVPSWLRQRAWSSPFLASWWLVGLAPDCGAPTILVTPFSHALV